MAALYHARIYDPETGRFLHPDPVHSENAGMDNWDRHAYVNGNPVNFSDPTGESMQVTSDEIAAMALIQAAPNPGVVLNMLWIEMHMHGAGKPSGPIFVPFHEYSGNGNRDPFDNFNGSRRAKTAGDLVKYAIWVHATASSSTDIAVAFAVASLLAPKPADMVDAAALVHDHETPYGPLGCIGSRGDAQMVRANGKWISSTIKAQFSFGYYRGLYGRAYEDSAWVERSTRSASLRSVVASVKTLQRLEISYLARGIGTLAFAVDSILRTSAKGAQWLGSRTNGLKGSPNTWRL